MRLVLALAALACSAATASAAEDRYGPSTPRGTGASAYAGPLLGWTGKTAPVAPASLAAATRPQPLPGGLYRPLAQPQAAAAPVAALPTSLYDRPAPPTRAQAAALPPPPAAPAVAGGLYANAAPRFYSVHRPFGAEPDPIPAPPPGGSWAYRPEASLAGAIRSTGAGDGVIPEGDRPASADDADWAAGQDPREGDR